MTDLSPVVEVEYIRHRVYFTRKFYVEVIVEKNSSRVPNITIKKKGQSLTFGWQTFLKLLDAGNKIVTHVSPKQKAKDGWISVDEKLPGWSEVPSDCSDEVIVYMMGGYERRQVGVYYHQREVWVVINRIYTQEYVTHWMPLPEPPTSNK